MRGYRLIGRGLTPSAGPAVRRGGVTALMKAAYNFATAAVVSLAERRANLDAQDNHG